MCKQVLFNALKQSYPEQTDCKTELMNHNIWICQRDADVELKLEVSTAVRIILKYGQRNVALMNWCCEKVICLFFSQLLCLQVSIM